MLLIGSLEEFFNTQAQILDFDQGSNIGETSLRIDTLAISLLSSPLLNKPGNSGSVAGSGATATTNHVGALV